MYQVTPGIGYPFGLVEEALQENFFPALFHGMGEGAPVRGVTRLTVEQTGLALPDPTNTSPENWTASCVITDHLFVALRCQVEFWTADHSACLREGRAVVQRRIVLLVEESLTKTIAGGAV